MKITVEHRGITRKAKGFSGKEIMDAGINCHSFCSLKLPFDMRRETSYKENVAALKEAAKNAPARVAKPKAVKK